MKKLLTMALLSASLLFAEDSAFVTHTAIGYVSTEGNTNTTTTNVDATVKKTIGNNAFNLELHYLYGNEDGVENNNKFEAIFNYDYSLVDWFALNYLAGYKNDHFSGFDYQIYTGPGVKFIPLAGEVHALSFQTNVLYSRDSLSDKYYEDANLTVEIPHPFSGPFVVDGEARDYTSFYAMFDYGWQITETLKFVQMASYRAEVGDSNNYFVTSNTGLQSKISDIFSMGLDYRIDYVNQQPDGNEKTDKVFTASLIIDY